VERTRATPRAAADRAAPRRGYGPALAAAALVLLSACALGPRPGPPPDAPTESALSAAPPPDVCRVSPGSLRRIGPVEAGTTPLGEALEKLGRPPGDPSGDAACWGVPGEGGAVLHANGRALDQPVRSLVLARADAETARRCATTSALSAPLSLEAGLRLGMAREEVERTLGNLEPDEGGAFGKECCGLEQTGAGEAGPVYGFGCSAVLGVFREGKLASLLVSRYAPPSTPDAGAPAPPDSPAVE
jgi:hypothetical protein